jgi:phosphoribosylglycinamide formyltransferase-1
MNIGLMASHNGSNAQAVIDACKSALLQLVTTVVISNNSNSGAIARAKQEGIPFCHLSQTTHPQQYVFQKGPDESRIHQEKSN